VRQALEKMRYHHYVAIPVLDDDGIYVGTLRNDDIFKYFLENGKFDSRAAERDSVMSILDEEYSKPLYHNATVNELIENVKEHNFVPVVDDRGCFIGMILRRDVLNFLSEYYESAKDK
jgi:CBS domain-containing protein